MLYYNCFMAFKNKKEAFLFILSISLFFLSMFLIACSVAEKDSTAKAYLKIQFSDGGSSTLSCPEDLSCARLDRLIEDDKLYLFQMPQQACTMIYGGPGSVSIEGTYKKKPVSITRTRSDGCQIEQYDLWTSFLKNES